MQVKVIEELVLGYLKSLKSCQRFHFTGMKMIASVIALISCRKLCGSLVLVVIIECYYTAYCAMCMHSADYAVARCLSICLSIHLSHNGILSKWLNIS